MNTSITVHTDRPSSFIDITGKVAQIAAEQGDREAVCTLYCPHTTCGLTINENADPDVRHDMITELNKIIPFEDGYLHREGNSAAHIKASLMGSSLQIPISDGKLMLGIWQGIYLCEFDGPRTRRLTIVIR